MFTSEQKLKKIDLFKLPALKLASILPELHYQLEDDRSSMPKEYQARIEAQICLHSARAENMAQYLKLSMLGTAISMGRYSRSSSVVLECNDELARTIRNLNKEYVQIKIHN